MPPPDTLDPTTEPPVLTRREGRLGHLVLNRPRAINALTLEMVTLLTAQLEEWATDDEVGTVVLSGAGSRGLCAGGDMVALWRDARAGGSAAAAFWADEYRLNALIAEYPKTFVAIMDGIVLGGGIGLSAHAGTRVVTERSSIGMPETGIGFLPDVGGTWLLSRTPGETGTHLALTAGSVGAADAIALGLADHMVPSDRLADLLERLAVEDPADAVAAVEFGGPEPELPQARSWIDSCYAGDDLALIVERLLASDDPAAREAAATIARRSPTALTVTLRALRESAGYTDLRESLDLEYRLARRLFATHDAAEGIRAQLVDKDRTPHWDPATVDAVDPALVESCFASLGDDELGLARG